MNSFKELAKLITLSESENTQQHGLFFEYFIEALQKKKKSLVIGISGSPGVGKSTFLNAFVSLIAQDQQRKSKKTIALLLLDPESKKTGGSILGDAIRMGPLFSYDNIYIRTSSTKALEGGIKKTTFESIVLCNAFDIDLIFVESVGVGQNEYELREFCDLFFYLNTPFAGDDIQAFKKGILEVADALIINKIDLNLDQQKRVVFQQKKIFQDLGIPLFFISAQNGQNLEEIQNFIEKNQECHFKTNWQDIGLLSWLKSKMAFKIFQTFDKTFNEKFLEKILKEKKKDLWQSFDIKLTEFIQQISKI